VEAFTTLLEAQVLVEDWRIEDNTVRPHSALGYLTPTDYAKVWTTNHSAPSKPMDQQPGPGQLPLDEYDQACRQHDAEMDSIRVAFMAKWGRVPVLELYRQMAIRQQKAKSFEQALWWVERGIAIYGTDCARAEAVEDLQKRAASYRAKLNPQPCPPRPRAVRVHLPEVEVLTCSTCGREFHRTRLRGRKPLHCPECRDQTA
jgi:hypothetical protein